MRGAKLEVLKATQLALLEELDAGDRLALVSFNDTARLCAPLRCCAPPAQQARPQ
jgi:hypothetical protein